MSGLIGVSRPQFTYQGLLILGLPTLLFVIPSLLLMSRLVGSLAAGCLLMAMLWLLAAQIRRPVALPIADRTSASGGVITICCMAAVAIHLAVVFLTDRTGDVHLVSGLATLAALLVFFAGSTWMASAIDDASPRLIDEGMGIAFCFFVACGAYGITALPPIEASWSKPILVFTEPSHFALALTPISIYLANRCGGIKRALIVMTMLAFALGLTSLTMLAATALVLASNVRMRIGLPIAGLCLALIVTTGASYYIERLDFLQQRSQNLSAMVFVNGWMRSADYLEASNGLGVGFQQFGHAGEPTALDPIILELQGPHAVRPLNLYDGGSLAPKIVGEFGLLGILGLGLFVIQVTRSVYWLRRHQASWRKHQGQHAAQCFAHSAIVAMTIEVFVRGYGYFSPGVFLFATACLLLYRQRKTEIAQRRIMAPRAD